MSSSVQSLADYGTAGLLVDIECSLSNNLPTIVIVGFVSRAVDEARERVRGAFVSSGIDMPRKRITINLAPADIPKASSSFDLAIAAAIILAAQREAKILSRQEAIMGELGLDGIVRPVRGVIGKIIAGRSHGITTFYIPRANLSQALLVPGVRLVPLDSLRELYTHLCGLQELAPLDTGAGGYPAATEPNTAPSDHEVSLADIVGQEQAKRALEIAAAGGHNVLLSGPPGTGKSMLARALPGLLPRLSSEEMLEVTHLHSLSGSNYDSIVTSRPFRAPHHSISHVATVGGGSVLRPGEVSLAHRGVLFFDEFPEFNRPTIEALRQPLEDRRITIARTKDRVEYPADFILIATANPCPCGFYGLPMDATSRRVCDCPPAAVQRYRSKLSGPIMDRIDLFSDVHGVDHANLLDTAQGRRQSDEAIKTRIARARAVQQQRYGTASILNAGLNNRDIIEHAHIDPAAKTLLDSAGSRLGLSARSYLRTVKVARTIADLDSSQPITIAHISEALQYRSRESI